MGQKSELERYKEALAWVLGSPLPGSSQLVKVSVHQILDPPPEMETVEEVRWFNVGVHGVEWDCPWATYDRAKIQATEACIATVSAVIKFQRPKPQPVERISQGVVSGRSGMVPTIHVTIPGMHDVPPMGADVTITWEEK